MQILDDFFSILSEAGRDPQFLAGLNDLADMRSDMTDAGAQQHFGHAIELADQWKAGRPHLVEAMFGDCWLPAGSGRLAAMMGSLDDASGRAAIGQLLHSAQSNMSHAIDELDGWMTTMQTIRENFIEDNRIYADWNPHELLKRAMEIQEQAIARSDAGALMALEPTRHAWRILRTQVNDCLERLARLDALGPGDAGTGDVVKSGLHGLLVTLNDLGNRLIPQEALIIPHFRDLTTR